MKQILKKQNSSSILQIAGDVQDVLKGQANLLQPIEPMRFRFALGSGSFFDKTAIGETIVIEKVPHISWISKSQPRIQSGRDAKTPFLMGLDEHQTGTELFYYKPAEPISLELFYEQTSRQYPEGFAVVGEAQMAALHSTYLKKPPIYGENINEHQADYWMKIPMESHRHLCFFAVVIPSEGKKRFPSEVLNKAFYQNPHETNQVPFLSHTHGALLTSSMDQKPESFDDFFQNLKNLPITAVRHVLNPSLIQEGVFAIFSVEQIKTVRI